MNADEMYRRREAAIEALQDAIDQLGPLTDRGPPSLRDPVLEIIDSLQQSGEELEELVLDAGAEA